jgi:RimJ/RimL family protein N-acetyltransferase
MLCSELTMLPATFQTTRLFLRPVETTDVDAIFDTCARDAEVCRYLIWRPHQDRSETHTFVAQCLATPAESERVYLIIGRDDGVLQRVRSRCAGRLRIVSTAAICRHVIGGGKG